MSSTLRLAAHYETIHQLEWPAEPRGEVSGVRSQELLSREPLFAAGIHSRHLPRAVKAEGNPPTRKATGRSGACETHGAGE
ncbi:hypothetical protein [Nocardia vulneris]|uniref:hypothetical protein n=1 Tax=Nocardia vulneris TaxID=1141657 RepID=UPI0012E764EB|nr:hypothetical protein [Nocardia vulneris]